VQRWLDRYLKHKGVGKPGADPLLSTSFEYLEPTGKGNWSPVTLERSKLLSFYHCSAYSVHDRSGELAADGDIADVGC
jgi:hypothetical protein